MCENELLRQGIRKLSHKRHTDRQTRLKLYTTPHIPPFRLSTVGRRSFPVAAAILWMEHTAGGCPVIPFTSGLPPASEDIPLPQIIS